MFVCIGKSVGNSSEGSELLNYYFANLLLIFGLKMKITITRLIARIYIGYDVS